MRTSTLLLFITLALTAFAMSQAAPPSSPPPSSQSQPASPAGTASQENTQNNGTSQQQPENPNPPATYNENQSNQGTFGQRAAQPSDPGGREIPAGANIRATLDTPLSTKTSQVGDRFTATVSEPIRDSNGQIAIPVGTKINGQVSTSEQGKSVAILRGKGRMDLRFIDMTLPTGVSTPLTATLKSVNSTSGGTQQSDSEGGIQSGTSGKTTAKDVGIGAGIGTVAGLIFGSALKGLAIGAIAGGGYVLATKGKDVELPANTGLVLSLDRPLQVPANTAGR